MIYVVHDYTSKSTCYVDQATFDANSDYTENFLVVGSKEDAEAKLIVVQKAALEKEATRFSVCATFVSGNDTTWREVQESDPEDTVCQVFDYETGTYTECANKTEAYALNEQKKQQFLMSIALDKVYEENELPKPPVFSAPSVYSQNTYGNDNGSIPVEVM